jgi:hypothetical protein
VRGTLTAPLPILADPLPVGPQGVNMPRTAPWEIPHPDTIWNAVADLDHDYRDEAGKQVHSYHCRRCRLELLLHQITDVLGTPPDCPEKVPLVRSSKP